MAYCNHDIPIPDKLCIECYPQTLRELEIENIRLNKIITRIEKIIKGRD